MAPPKPAGKITLPQHGGPPKPKHPQMTMQEKDVQQVDNWQDFAKKLPVLQRLANDVNRENKYAVHQPRPGFSEVNEWYCVFTNHYQMTLATDTTKPIYLYSVEFEDYNRRTHGPKSYWMRRLFECEAYLRENEDKIARDNSSTIISSVDLSHAALGMPTGIRQVVSQTQVRRNANDPDGLSILANVKYLGTISFNAFNDFCNGIHDNLAYDATETCRLINIILSKVAARTAGNDTRTFQIGKKHFLEIAERAQLGNVLYGMRGFFASARPAMGLTVLNVNPVMSPFLQPLPVTAFLRNYEEPAKSAKALRGVKVTVDLENTDRDGYRILRVGDILSKQIDNKGQKDAGDMSKAGDKSKTVLHLLRSKYPDTSFNDDDLSVRLDRFGWYTASRSTIVPNQRFNLKPLPSAITRRMIDVALRKPRENLWLLRHRGLQALGLNSTELAQFGIHIDTRLMAIPARIIAAPEIRYRGSEPVKIEGSRWDLKQKQFCQPPKDKVKVHYLIAFLSGRLHDRCSDLQRPLVQNLQRYGMSVDNQSSKTSMRQDESFAAAVRRCVQEARDKKATMVIFINPQSNQNDPFYSEFKRTMDREGLPSMCLRHGQLKYSLDEKGLMQYLGNLALKINMKMRGVNHVLVDTHPRLVGEKGPITMVLGADITHPSNYPSSANECPSVAALVASVDAQLGRFAYSMVQHERRRELIDAGSMKRMLLHCLKVWHRQHKALPKNVLYYRDGVSESQYGDLRRTELNEIREAFKEFASEKKLAGVPPNITAISVSKRHHVRFYGYTEGNLESHGPNWNCLPGTCVETDITSPYQFDFYLQSHKPIQGTAKSAHYVVLEDEMKWGAQELGDLTHHICHLYAKATSPVSYASPSYYAHLLCERGRTILADFFQNSNAVEGDTTQGRQNMLDDHWGESRNRVGPWHPSLNESMHFL